MRMLTAVLLAILFSASGQQSAAPAPKPLPDNKACPYPPAAQMERITGPVRFEAQVKPDGAVESVEIKRAPWPGVGFEDAVRDCVAQWRFEPGAAEDGPRLYEGQVRFRVAPGAEVAVRQAVEALARAWNADDKAALEDLELRRDELPGLSLQEGHFLRKTVQADSPSDRFLIELEPDVVHLRFARGDLVRLRQLLRRMPREGAGGQAQGTPGVLDLTAVKGPRGWRFAQLSSNTAAFLDAARVGGTIKEPRKLRDVRPKYPNVAKQAGVQGVVILECVISREGKVIEIRVLRGLPLLDEAAIEAVKGWLYEPTLLNGEAVPVIMTVTVNFRLS